MPRPKPDENANAWMRSKAKVQFNAGGSTFKVPRDQRPAVDVGDGTPQPTPEEQAAAGGANGGERGYEPPPSFDDAIRKAFWGTGSLRGTVF
jgi:hypothetical protein